MHAHADLKEATMQPQSGNTLIDRVLQWIRRMWAESANRRSSGQSGSGDATGSRSRSGEGSSPPQPDRSGSVVDGDTGDVAANGSPGDAGAGGTGASQDEFAKGGYTPDNPDLKTVEDAAETPDDPGQQGSNPGDPPPSSNPESLADQQLDGPTPPSGNYGVGNLGLGSRGSLGTEPPTGASEGASADTEPAANTGVGDSSPVDLSHAAIPDDTDSRQPGVVDIGGTQDIAPSLGGTAGDEGLSSIDEMNVRGIGDLGADELGSLEELDEDALAFADDASERFDANSEPGFATHVPDSLAEIDRETDDYSSSALQDAGLRIVDEDDAGLTLREPSDEEFVDPGSAIDEPAVDTGDARPLSDFTQGQSGFASESDEPTGAAGDRSAEPFGSETGMATTETWTGQPSNEDLGEAGELEALDFGSTAGEKDRGLAATGLFGTSDIDVSDLSYLDESENARFDFSDLSADVPDSAGPVDDIGASPSGVSDSEGVVESEEPIAAARDAGSSPDREVTPNFSAGVVDDLADSPTGVVDADATSATLDDGRDKQANAREHVPLTAPSAASTGSSQEPVTGSQVTPTGNGPGGSVRGDETGSCPADFPIKGNNSSKVYHVPGIPSHQGTKAEWCFATEEQAQAAGYRPPGQRNRGGGQPRSSDNRGR